MQQQICVKQNPSSLGIQGRAGDFTTGCQCYPTGVGPVPCTAQTHLRLLGHHKLWETLQAGVGLPEMGPAGRTTDLNASARHHRRPVQLQTINPNQFCTSAAGISAGGNIITQANKLLAW